jgi:hypothetical protein
VPYGAQMAETWQLGDEPVSLTSETAERALRAEFVAGNQMVTLTSSLGRILLVVTNGTRAMVVLMDTVGDAGQHATDPDAPGVSGGFVLDNGQVDEYANADTVELEEALVAVRQLVAGLGATTVIWHNDR